MSRHIVRVVYTFACWALLMGSTARADSPPKAEAEGHGKLKVTVEVTGDAAVASPAAVKEKLSSLVGKMEGGHAVVTHIEEHHDGAPLNVKGDLVLWSLVTFVILAAVLRKFAWGPLTAGLDRREAGIRQNIADAESARLKAERMLVEHERKLAKVQDEVKEILAEARRDADHARQTILGDAAREAEATRNRAIADIERAKNSALDELFNVMSDRVLSATEHVIGRSLNDGDQRRLVDEALAQVSHKA